MILTPRIPQYFRESEFDVDKAVRTTISYDVGCGYTVADEAASHAKACESFLGNLVQILHQRGVLTDDDILALVPRFKRMPREE